MKSKLLAAVASFAFVASGVAFAQESPKKEQPPAAERAAPAAAPRAAQMERKQDNAKGEMKTEQPRMQAQKAGEPNEMKKTGDANEMKTEKPRAAQAQPEKSEMRKDNAQAKPDTMQRKDNAQAEPNGKMERKENAKGDEAQPNRAAERANDKREARSTGKVQISQEHAARVGDVLRRGARPMRPDFDVRVGVRVPESFEVRPLPEDVIALVPEYRGYNYFLDADNEIVFVSPETHEIVGTIDYEGRAASVDSPRGARPCPVE
jgi:hypothetical protein